MLKWEIKNGDEKLKQNIKNTKKGFDKWFKNSCWAETCSKEKC